MIDIKIPKIKQHKEIAINRTAKELIELLISAIISIINIKYMIMLVIVTTYTFPIDLFFFKSNLFTS